MKSKKNFTVIEQLKHYYSVHKYWILLSVFVLMLNSACSSDTIELNTGSYYGANTTQRWNLKGNVKSVSINDDNIIFEFNKEGFVTKKTDNLLEFNPVKKYSYDSSGRLQNIVSYFQAYPESYSTESYTYDHTDRFVLKEPSDLVTNFSEFAITQVVNDLVLGLKMIKGPSEDYNYSFVGDTLYLYQTLKYSDTNPNAITKVIYNGKYPVQYSLLESSSNTTTTYKDIVFSDFGNLLHFSKEFSVGESNILKQTYYYKPGYPTMLLDSITEQSGVSRTLVEKFTYNSKMDLQQHIFGDGTWEFDYTYDSHDNWITKIEKVKMNSSANWVTLSTTSRVIKYW